MKYAEAKALHAKARNPEAGKPIARNTRVVKTQRGYGIKLHDTVVVDIMPNNSFYVYSGSWHTITTNDRISAYAPPKYFHGFHNQNGYWYGGGSYFYEGMKFSAKGKLLSKPLLPSKRVLDGMREVSAVMRSLKHTPSRWTYNFDTVEGYAHTHCKYCKHSYTTRGEGYTGECSETARKEQDRLAANAAARERREVWKILCSAEKLIQLNWYDNSVLKEMTQAEFQALVKAKGKRVLSRYKIMPLVEYIAKRMLNSI